jgi:RNA polymerase sigma factor (sigma-70 family)
MSAAATALLAPRRQPRPAAVPVVREDDDLGLARRAAAGDGAAFAALYDRHERRTYNLCYRITGSRDDAADATQETFLKVLERLPGLADRDLNFGAYVLTAARHASYDAIARRRRTAPTDDIPESAVPVGAGGDEPDRPEHHALLEAHQEEIRAANEGLPARQREVLALRELEGLSYDEVAEIMGMNRNSVAQLISRARINLRDGLRRTALGSVAGSSPLCDEALPLLAMRQDDALDDPASASWILGHLADCGTCRVRVAAMEEAGVAYRLWLPLVPVLWLRGAATAKAAERVGADWSSVAAGPAARPGRRLMGMAGGVAVLVAVVLLAAERADAPLHMWTPSAPVSTSAPVPVPTAAPIAAAPKQKPKPKPKPVHRQRVHHAPTPVSTPAAIAATVPAATSAPPQPVQHAAPPTARKRSKPVRPVVTPVPTPVAPDPPAVVVVTDPPRGGGGPDSSVPRCPGDPRCVPKPPPVCTTCNRIAPNPRPPSQRGLTPLAVRAVPVAKVPPAK